MSEQLFGWWTKALQQLSRFCYDESAKAGWWNHPRNKGELIALMHSELSEALEGERKGCMDDHLPHRRMTEIELADVLIRVFDYAGAFGYDIGGALIEKVLFNRTRADHKQEIREAEGGKKF